LIQTVLTSIAVALRIAANPVGNVFQKQLTSRGHHPLRVNFLTYLLLALVCVIPAVFVSWGKLPPAFWMFSILGGIVGAVGNGFLVKALEKGDLSVLGPVNAYKAVVGMIAGVFLLREIPNLWGLIGVGLIIFGSYFVLDTTEARFSWRLFRRREIQFRIWAMILTAIEAVFIKKIILASSTMIAFISWCWFGAFFSLLLLFIAGARSRPAAQVWARADYTRYALLVICIGTMQFSTNYAFDHMPVAYALSLFQLSTVVSVLLGHRIFGEQEIRKKLIGSAIMLMGSVVIILMNGR
jgi:drug/metabolite transporter (DMT)-like permease